MTPFKWSEIFAKQNTVAKAKVDKRINDSTDPHVLLQINLRELQENHDKLEKACAVVIGQFKTAEAKLAEDLETERQLTTQGQAAYRAGHLDSAKAIALRLGAVQTRLHTERATFDAGKARADEAKAAFAANAELLRQKIDEASALDAEIDQAAMEHDMNEAMKAVTSMTARTTPSFDQIKGQVRAQHSMESADAELQGSVPDMSAITAQHEGVTDDILAQWATPEIAAATPAKAIRAAPQAKPQEARSATDRLNE